MVHLKMSSEELFHTMSVSLTLILVSIEVDFGEILFRKSDFYVLLLHLTVSRRIEVFVMIF